MAAQNPMISLPEHAVQDVVAALPGTMNTNSALVAHNHQLVADHRLEQQLKMFWKNMAESTPAERKRVHIRLFPGEIPPKRLMNKLLRKYKEVNESFAGDLHN